jgi:hypothetical protein
MALSNYLHGARLDLLRRACERAGLELRQVGMRSDEGARPSELVLNDADIVVGKGRTILEAMACGRAAYGYDVGGGEGWVTADTYPELVADNFGGQSRPIPFDEETLAADLAAYDPAMGLVNRDLAVAHHAATKHAADLVGVLSRVAPRAAPVDAPFDELGRLVRMFQRVDAQQYLLYAEAERLNLVIQQLEDTLRHVIAERDALRAQSLHRGRTRAAQLRSALRQLRDSG